MTASRPAPFTGADEIDLAGLDVPQNDPNADAAVESDDPAEEQDGDRKRSQATQLVALAAERYDLGWSSAGEPSQPTR